MRHVLSVRTLIEMSLIRASRIATTATIEELLKAVRALKEGKNVELPSRPVVASAPVAAPASAPQPPEVSRKISASRQAILDDPKLNSMLGAFPGSGVVDIRDGN